MTPNQYNEIWRKGSHSDTRWMQTCRAPTCCNTGQFMNVSQREFLYKLYNAGWRLVSIDGEEPKPYCNECVSRIRALKKQAELTQIDVSNPDGIDPDADELEDLLDDDEAEPEDEVATAHYYEQETAARGGSHGGLRDGNDPDS